MNSLIEKEGLAGQVQMIYLDPPYGIRYSSNFQPFVNKRDVKEGKDEDLTQEPEVVKAFRDTWELGVHSYLTYLRDRLLLTRELLSDSGSVFIQINDTNLSYVNELAAEIFRKANFMGIIAFVTSSSRSSTYLPLTFDFLLWYAKDKQSVKYHQLFIEKGRAAASDPTFSWVEYPDGTRRRMTKEEKELSLLPKDARVFKLADFTSQGTSKPYSIELDGKKFLPSTGRHWRTHEEGAERLKRLNRLVVTGKSVSYVRYLDDFALSPISNLWTDTGTGSFTDPKIYVVQTGTKTISRCILMTTDPGDLVFDPTCGSGTTAYAAEKLGRRWMACDSSRISISLTKQRLMTALFDYYELYDTNDGVRSGFKYETSPYVTLKSLAYGEPPVQLTLYDQPIVDAARIRVSGPFTVEAVPSPIVKPISDLPQTAPADGSINRSDETLRQAEWRDELLRTGIRGKDGQYVRFSRVEPLPGTRWLHADAETKEAHPKRGVISFGPEHSPLEQRQVALAIEESLNLVPEPKMVIFASFHFDPEAAKDIDEMNWPGIILLKVQMNADLLTEDLKKKRASNESFWLIGQPDVLLNKITEGAHTGEYQAEVFGFDYYNTKTGNIESGGAEKIAMWMLDTDYDGRSLFPRQVFFPLSGERDGWYKLARTLKAEIREDLIEAYRGTVSLPFEIADNKRIAVKIIDDRGIESLRIIEVE